MAEDAKERLLRRIEGVLPAAKQSPGKPDDPLFVPHHEHIERLAIASFCTYKHFVSRAFAAAIQVVCHEHYSRRMTRHNSLLLARSLLTTRFKSKTLN